jgi:hypothetical protein
MLTEELKTELEKQFDETPDYVIGVSYGFKKTNGQKTNQKSIIYKVSKKKPLGEIPKNEIIPASIKVNGKEYVTDVVEGTKAQFFNCFVSESDPSIQRLQGVPNLLAPMRGGNEIVLMPDGWSGPTLESSGYTVGTLGFFAVDNYDDKVVGVTNSHVAVLNRVFCNERNIKDEDPNPYNTVDPRPWENILPDLEIEPKCAVWNNTNLLDASANIKRYMPVTAIGRNYIDCALLVMNKDTLPASATAYIDSTSYQVWQPIGEPDYPTHMPFATKQELDNLLTSNPNLYSTGRTTGPKGWSPVSSCILRVTEIGVNETIGGLEGDTYWSDTIKFQYEDGVGYPAKPGDSGSVVIADFSGVRKIVGLLFAGNETESYGLFCRIDRLAAIMNIRAWDSSYVLDKSYSTKTEIVVTPEANLGGTPNFVQNGKHFWQSGFRYITTPAGYTPTPTPTPAPVIASWQNCVDDINNNRTRRVCSMPWLTTQTGFFDNGVSSINTGVTNATKIINSINLYCCLVPIGTTTGADHVQFPFDSTINFNYQITTSLGSITFRPVLYAYSLRGTIEFIVMGSTPFVCSIEPTERCQTWITPFVGNPKKFTFNTSDIRTIPFVLTFSGVNVNLTIRITSGGSPAIGVLGNIALYYISNIANNQPLNLSEPTQNVQENSNSVYIPSISMQNVQSKQKLLPSSVSTRTKLCQYASKMPLEVIDSYHGKTAIRRCDIYGFCSHSIKIPDRPEVYSCQECPNYFSNENVPEELLIFTDKNREETIKIMNINNQQAPEQSLYQEIKYKKVEDFLKKEEKNTFEVEYKDLTEVSEQNLKDMNAMKIKPIDNIKPNVDELLGE